MKKENIKIKTIKARYIILKICSKPKRIEAQIVFDRKDISQKLIFSLMEICHHHGFGCSPPMFGETKNADMTFFIGTTLSSVFAKRGIIKRLEKCLDELKTFMESFSKQLDFSTIDISMFDQIDPLIFNPTEIAAVRDQHYNGSWEHFRADAESIFGESGGKIISICIEFEDTNNKDIGLVGHKLIQLLHKVNDKKSSGDSVLN